MMKSEVAILEKLFIKSGEIIDVRRWDGGNMYEIDVQLPKVDFGKWSKVKSIKCRVGNLHYTDYTPAIWNSEEKTCTLYIDTSHSGQGSNWAKLQQEGNIVHYLKIEDEKHIPLGNHLVFLGDQTAIGHFCALKQLAAVQTQISGIITFNDQRTADAFLDNCAWLPLTTSIGYESLYEETENFLNKNRFNYDELVFYIVGNSEMVVRLRRSIKAHGISPVQIKSKGFWH
ncbi:ferredoxin reductase domain-containing protein [Flavobacterium rhizosphaerae]|uniref:FAD-binding FR-type domain-containing protein n=1 Tax=Flavobacterium rhizosphaerae TaxID=3163298 RepID=A0ABW8Z071_9FLAO